MPHLLAKALRFFLVPIKGCVLARYLFSLKKGLSPQQTDAWRSGMSLVPAVLRELPPSPWTKPCPACPSVSAAGMAGIAR